MDEEELQDAFSYYRRALNEPFENSGITNAQIDQIISLVLSQELDSPDENIETMINLLIRTGELPSNETKEDEVPELATATTPQVPSPRHYQNLLQLCPDISKTYLLNFCEKHKTFNFDVAVDNLLSVDYPKQERDPVEIWEQLKQMLPNADPIYLRNNARALVNRPPEDLQFFVEEAIEKANYPTMQEFLKASEQEANRARFANEFNVHDFLQEFPNPVATFQDPARVPALAPGKASESDVEYALSFLYNRFNHQRKRDILTFFSAYDYNLMKTFMKLKKRAKAFREPREPTESPECTNLLLLQEICFLKYEKVIRQVIKHKDEKYRTAYQEAKAYNLLQTCGMCFVDEFIPEECLFCENDCIFCKECVKLGTETAIGLGKISFPCFSGDCKEEFSYATIRMVLDKKVFDHLWRRKQIDEVRKANIIGLETCPFCDFSMVPMEGDRIFKCANVDCMKESCRECHHVAHLPLRCNEVEYDEDVKKRTYIENKMSEALIRTCWKCSKKFYKSSGCNKMTCPCGALMCYVCNAKITNYEHFGSNRCPLFNNNDKEFHLERVRDAAKAAKNELGVDVRPDLLKFDPTRNLDEHVH